MNVMIMLMVTKYIYGVRGLCVRCIQSRLSPGLSPPSQPTCLVRVQRPVRWETVYRCCCDLLRTSPTTMPRRQHRDHQPSIFSTRDTRQCNASVTVCARPRLDTAMMARRILAGNRSNEGFLWTDRVGACAVGCD